MANAEHHPSSGGQPEDRVRLRVEFNRHIRHMYGVSWREQYGDPIEALAKVEAVDVELMSPEDRLKWQKRLARRL